MINTEMRLYDYYEYGENDAYGQPKLSDAPVGTVKMAIYLTTQSIQDNINYHSATYIGFTHALLDDSKVIDYEGKKLKVLYVERKGRIKQAFMSEI